MSRQLLTHFLCPGTWYVIIITFNTHHWSCHSQASCHMSLPIIVRCTCLNLNIACYIKSLLYPPRRKTVNWRKLIWTKLQHTILDKLSPKSISLPSLIQPANHTHSLCPVKPGLISSVFLRVRFLGSDPQEG